MGDEALAAIAASRTLKLARFDAGASHFTNAAGASIANAVWAPMLEHLDLSSNEEFGNAGLEALAGSSRLTRLRSLVLYNTGIDDSAADIVLRSPVCARLERIEMTACLSPKAYERVKAVFGDRLMSLIDVVMDT